MAEPDRPTAVAERWFALPGPDTALRGAAFDAAGNLLLCNVMVSRVRRLSPARRLSVLPEQAGPGPGRLVVRPDGRIMIAASTADFVSGSVSEMDASGANRRFLLPPMAGAAPTAPM